MSLHPRHNIILKAHATWTRTESGSALYNYSDLFRAFLTEVVPFQVENQDMVDAMRRDFRVTCEEHRLTPGEQAILVGKIVQSNARYVIRFERHGNFEKQGDEA